MISNFNFNFAHIVCQPPLGVNRRFLWQLVAFKGGWILAWAISRKSERVGSNFELASSQGRAFGPKWNFGVRLPCGLCEDAMSATGLFNLTLSLLARYDG
jgi:hypothetical protein